MSNRGDIIDGSQAAGSTKGLIYTKKCGWVDLGHANPIGGAANLLTSLTLNNHGIGNKYYKLPYSQWMQKRGVKVGIIERYIIKKDLSPRELKSVALSIFMDVSNEFESFQNNWLFRKFTNSGYSAEDLVSDLISFYRAVDPETDYIQLCEPVPKETALYIWDTYGPVGENKNRTFAPYLYPLSPTSGGGPMSVEIPWFLNTIKPGKEGKLFEKERYGIGGRSRFEK